MSNISTKTKLPQRTINAYLGSLTKKETATPTKEMIKNVSKSPSPKVVAKSPTPKPKPQPKVIAKKNQPTVDVQPESTYIPEEVLGHIVQYLGVKAKHKLLYVSKSWNKRALGLLQNLHKSNIERLTTATALHERTRFMYSKHEVLTSEEDSDLDSNNDDFRERYQFKVTYEVKKVLTGIKKQVKLFFPMRREIGNLYVWFAQNSSYTFALAQLEMFLRSICSLSKSVQVTCNHTDRTNLFQILFDMKYGGQILFTLKEPTNWDNLSTPLFSWYNSL
jgi:hypothetical protein